jgi:hypothetical protein
MRGCGFATVMHDWSGSWEGLAFLDTDAFQQAARSALLRGAAV